ncbi:MAG: hypothetical protein L3J71_09445 [Victivallaceae bacterium]|nr:hypothetical protein [Victivallaceae bacterium]
MGTKISAMNIYFSTVVRHAPVNNGGELVLLDWNNKKCIKSVPVYPKDPEIIDPNPRGNSRGGRGIEIIDDKVYASSFHTIEVYNKNLDLLRTISNNNFAGIHETCQEGNGLWITATSIDAAIKIDYRDGKVLDQLWPRDNAVFAEKFTLTPLEIDKNIDNRRNFLFVRSKEPGHLHLNSITTFNDNIYALFNRQGAIVNLTDNEVIIEDELLKGGHSLKAFANGLAFANSTRGHKLLIYDLIKQVKIREIDLLQYDVIEDIQREYKPSQVKRFLSKLRLVRYIKARPLFWRGLAVHNDHVFIGLSPAAILCINYQTQEFVDFYRHSPNVREAVHGLELDI